jgi:CheY-like chemotaxis protein
MEMEMDALRILIVEDQPELADSTAQVLELWGYQATVAYEGEQALELAATWNPDVVCLDLGLPGMDGYEVARQLRRLPGMRKVLVIAITGFRGAAVVQRCKEVGIDYHFPKPADLDELERLLRLFARAAAAFASSS